MKPRILPFCLSLCLLLSGRPAQSAVITWTNTLGGLWQNAANWSPNKVPASGDDVVVTNGGTYTVTNSSTLTLDSLTLGGTNGIQTLTGGALSFTNASMVDSNGVFNWTGGDFSGGSLTVMQGGTLTISNRVTFGFNAGNYQAATNGGFLTNDGTVIEADLGNGLLGYGGSMIYNAGLWQQVSPGSSLFSTYGSNTFINAGALQQVGGTGTTSIAWYFRTTGTMETTPGGTFSLDWNGPSIVNGNIAISGAIAAPLTLASNTVFNWTGGDVSGGALTVAPGGTLVISNRVTFGFNGGNYQAATNGGFLTNDGTVIEADMGNGLLGYGGSVIYNAGLWQQVSPGSSLLSEYGSNTFINAGSLQQIGGPGTTTINWYFRTTGTMEAVPGGTFALNWNGPSMVNGNISFSGAIAAALSIASNSAFNWSRGDLSGGSLNVAVGATLTISNRVTFGFNGGNYQAATNGGFLTNDGTVIEADMGNGLLGYGGSVIYNTGLWQQVSPGSSLLSEYGSNTFINDGALQQIGGAGTTTINWDFNNNGGTLSPPGGSFSFGDWTGNGLVFGNATIAGSFSGTLAAGSVLKLSGAINGASIIASNAVLNWSGGSLDGASLTVAQGGTLSVSNRVSFGFNGGNYQAVTNGGFLTNYGTVIQADSGNGLTGFGGSVIYNAGVWQQVSPGSALLEEYGKNTFINAGALQQIGGPGSTTINWDFNNNGGSLASFAGSFSMGDWTGAGTVAGNATVSGTFSGALAAGAVLNFSGAINGVSIIASNAVLNWSGGDLSGTALTVAQGGTLTISNRVTFGYNAGNYQAVTNGGFLTNDGTVIQADMGNGLRGYGGSVIYNAGLWQQVSPGSSLTFEYGTNIFINAGAFAQIGGVGATTIAWRFANDGGSVAASQGTVSFTGPYTDTAGANLSIALGSSTPGNGSGLIQFANPLTLLGTLTMTSENAFLPLSGSVFQVLSYPSATGVFGCMSLDLGGGVLLQPKFNKTGFALTVTNYSANASQPQLFCTVLSSGLFIQWPASYPGWELQSTTNLTTPVWLPVTVPCGTDIIVPETAPQKFYQLMHP